MEMLVQQDTPFSEMKTTKWNRQKILSSLPRNLLKETNLSPSIYTMCAYLLVQDHSCIIKYKQ